VDSPKPNGSISAADAPPEPPPPAFDGEPVPTIDDPTADGWFCGSRRKAGQIEHDRSPTNPNPWPWCRMRAGRGTDHVGIGRCSNHGGASPSGRINARLRLDQLVAPAIATIGRILADPDAPPTVRLAAARDVLSRSGFPARMDVDVDAARDSLVDRIMGLQAGDEAEN
jgi:hypothetical protein